MRVSVEKSFQNQLKIMREEAGITRSQLARKLHWDPSRVGKVEVGPNVPTLRVFKTYAGALGYSLELAFIKKAHAKK